MKFFDYAGKSVYKKAKISPFKLTSYASKIRGKDYLTALILLSSFPIKIRNIFWCALKSAMANFSKKFGAKKEKLVIINCYVTKGPVLKKQWARAKGKASAIRKRKAHVTIEVGLRVL